MDKLNLLLALHAHYSYAERKDTERLAKLAVGIDKMTDDLLKDIKVESAPVKETKPEPVAKPAEPKAPEKPAKETDTKIALDAAKKKAEEEATKIREAAEKKAKEEQKAKDEEGLIEVAPFYSCKVLAKGAKFPKDVKANAPRTFKAWRDEETAKAAKGETSYPDVDTLELVLDEAWNMACKGQTNKEIVVMLKKELEGYYPELKSDADYYSKLANPIVGMVSFIKKTFGYNAVDKTVTVTRPTEPGLTLKHDSDCYVEEKKEETPPAEEKKPEMKTVQSAKSTPAVKEERVDEEEQEKGMPAEEEDLDLELEAEEPERDTTNPPAVNVYENFTEFETMVFNKILEGAKIAAAAKDEASKKAVQAENREEVRNLIAAFYEGEEWTTKTEDGKWNPKLIGYHNSIITEISKSKAKWSK